MDSSAARERDSLGERERDGRESNPWRQTYVMTSVSSPGSLSSPSTNTEVLVKLWTDQVCPSSILNLEEEGGAKSSGQ